MQKKRRMSAGLGVALAAGLLSAAAWNSWAADPVDAQALQRAQREVKLLDTIYKSAIVLITENYVNESTDLAAGDAFQSLFKSMKDGGWHEVRLVDGLGEPIDPENKPRDAFERQAIQEVLAGKPGYEQVETIDGKPYLRSATTLPMVMDKCVMCHENYKGQKIVGALSYTLPLHVE